MPSTRSKYQRIPAKQQDDSPKPQNQIRLTTKGRDQVYINRGYHLFFEENLNTIVIKAAEKTIPKALKVAEILKKRIPGLHQVYKITSITLIDKYLPLEKGLLQVHQQKVISIIEIKLTKNPSSEDKAAPGYQQPVSKTDPLTPQRWSQIKEDALKRKKRYEERMANGGAFQRREREQDGDRRRTYDRERRDDRDRRDDRRDGRRGDDDRREGRRNDDGRRDGRRNDDDRRRRDQRSGSRDYRRQAREDNYDRRRRDRQDNDRRR